jgi:hypothetical protein
VDASVIVAADRLGITWIAITDRRHFTAVAPPTTRTVPAHGVTRWSGVREPSARRRSTAQWPSRTSFTRPSAWQRGPTPASVRRSGFGVYAAEMSARVGSHMLAWLRRPSLVVMISRWALLARARDSQGHHRGQYLRDVPHIRSMDGPLDRRDRSLTSRAPRIDAALAPTRSAKSRCSSRPERWSSGLWSGVAARGLHEVASLGQLGQARRHGAALQPEGVRDTASGRPRVRCYVLDDERDGSPRAGPLRRCAAGRRARRRPSRRSALPATGTSFNASSARWRSFASRASGRNS